MSTKVSLPLDMRLVSWIAKEVRVLARRIAISHAV